MLTESESVSMLEFRLEILIFLPMKVETPPRKARPRGRLEVLCQLLLAVVAVWAVTVLTIYPLDLPSQGGSDEFCDSFYIPPHDPLDPVYPYKNTFNISSPINWSGSGGSNALDKYR